MRREKERYILTLTPEPPGKGRLGRPPMYRLKVALKRLLRDQGLRCTQMEFHQMGGSGESSEYDTTKDNQ